MQNFIISFSLLLSAAGTFWFSPLPPAGTTGWLKSGEYTILRDTLGVKHIDVDTVRFKKPLGLGRNFLDSLLNAGYFSAGSVRTYVLDLSAPVIDSSATANEVIYFPKYITVDQWRVDGWVNYPNTGADSSNFKFAFNQSGLEIGGNAQLHKFIVWSSETGVASQTISFAALPPIASPDSTMLSVRVVREGGLYYISVAKHYTPGLTFRFSPPLTGGTNMAHIQISGALFPGINTSVQVRVAMWYIFRRY